MDRTFRIEELLDDAGWLRRLAAHLVGDAQADDLVQDTWLAALRRPPRAGEMRPWLRRVLANRAKNAGRDRARREARELDALREPVVAGPDEIAHTAEAQRLLAEAVARLDDPLRAVVVLRYYQGLESPEVGARLGITASAVRTRLQRALEALRVDLDGRVPGGRESWAALLVPLARGEGAGASATAVTATATAGGVAVWGLFIAGSAAVVIVAATALEGGEGAGRVRSSVTRNTTTVQDGADASVPGAADFATADAAGPQRIASVDEGSEDGADSALPADAVVAGVIRIDGREPEWPVHVALGPVLQERKPGVGEALPRKERAPRQQIVQPTTGGVFEFRGLPRGWRGRVTATGASAGISDATVKVAAPAKALILDLVSQPAVLGRVLDFEGRPASEVHGEFQLLTVASDGAAYPFHSGTRSFASREDGAIRLGCAMNMRWEGQVKLLIVIEDERAGRLVHETPPFVLTDGFDLGELRLEPLRALSFSVHDPSGAPIEGAYARIDGPSFRRSAPLTGPDGHGVLEILPDVDVDVRFTAPGYDEAIVRVAPMDAPEVVLRPLTRIDARTLGSAVSRAGILRVSSATDAFPWWSADGCGESAAFQLELGGLGAIERFTPAETGDGFEYAFAIRSGAAFHLAGAEPGIVLTLDLFDPNPHRQELLDSAVIILAPAERLEVTFGSEDGGGPPPKQTATMPVRERRSR